MNSSVLTRRRFLTSVSTATTLAALSPTGCTSSKRQLHLYIYPDYIDPKAVADFERIHGCQVTLDHFEDANIMLSKMAAGGASAYDIVVPGHFTLPGLIERKLVAPLRQEAIPNFSHLDPQFLNQSFDPKNTHSVPYAWGTTGIYTRRTDIRPEEELWGLLFDAKRQRGKFTLLEDPRLCLGAAQHYLGYKMNTLDLGELERSRDCLIDAKRRSVGFATGFAGRNQVLSGEADFAMAYSSDALIGERQDARTRYFVPREGAGIWLDALCISAQAPHRELAEAFINHLLDPRVNASNAQVIRAATANKSALEFINPKERNHPGIYPPPEVIQRLEYAVDLGSNNRVFDELWTQVKSR